MSNRARNVAVIPYENGTTRYRYARYISDDGNQRVRHGLFVAYHFSGQIASEGSYHHGTEHGPWQDFYNDGSLAAAGQYEHGKNVGDWRYFDRII